MTCPACKADTDPLFFCHFCDVYLPDASLGIKAGVARRFAAQLLDFFYALLVGFVTTFVLTTVLRSSGIIEQIDFSASVAIVLVGLLAYVLSVVWFWSQGKTPGKSLVGIRVVDKRTGGIPGLGRMFVREIVGKCASGFFLSLGYFWAIWDRDGQAWHDKIAGTLVLYPTASAVLAVEYLSADGTAEASSIRQPTLTAVVPQAVPSSEVQESELKTFHPTSFQEQSFLPIAVILFALIAVVVVLAAIWTSSGGLFRHQPAVRRISDQLVAQMRADFVPYGNWYRSLETLEMRHVEHQVFGLRAVELKQYGTGSGRWEGNLAVFDFCRPHFCSDQGGMLIVDVSSGQAAGILYDESEVVVYVGDYKSPERLPPVLQEGVEAVRTMEAPPKRVRYASAHDYSYTGRSSRYKLQLPPGFVSGQRADPDATITPAAGTGGRASRETGADSFAESPRNPGFRTYTNARFGFSIDYPASLVASEPPQNGDGIRLHSPDDSVQLVVSGGNNDGRSLQAYYRQEYDAISKANPSKMGYTSIGGNWFVITWEERDTISYRKIFVGSGSHNSFTLSYPESQKAEYDKLVLTLEKSFRAGDISQAW